MKQDELYMRIALEEAQAAFDADEVPVGAVLVRANRIIVRSHNLCVARCDRTAHAELIALSEGAQQLSGRLDGCTLYVTLEPCAMCAGAAINLQLPRLVFGAFDARAGCCGSVLELTNRCFPHTVEVWGGVLETECATILTRFFQQKRCNS